MWAHSRNRRGERHPLAEHLRGAAALAATFGDPFGASELAGYLGLVYDVGKGTCAWQNRLLEIDGTREKSDVEHKLAGTWLAQQAGLGPFAAAVSGHHGGRLWQHRPGRLARVGEGRNAFQEKEPPAL